MGGKSVTVGYWYYIAFHHGLGIGPLDALLEFRGGDKTAWQGLLTESGSISINAPNLWGGEKDQGGIVGELQWMNGDASQLPSAYLASTFGSQQSAWRGLSTVVFKGGKFGAMNPYPQKPSYKIKKIKSGWDSACWYPDKAEIPAGVQTWTAAAEHPYLDGNSAAMAPEDSADAQLLSGLLPTDVVEISVISGAWSKWLGYGSGTGYYSGSTDTPLWWCAFSVKNGAGVTTSYRTGSYMTAEGAQAAAQAEAPVQLTGSTSYHVYLQDDVLYNRGGLRLRIRVMRSRDVGWMNPAHILYYSRTQADMGREPAASLDEASFTAAADWFYAQGFGLCTSYDPSAESVEEFEQRICRVAGCSLTRSLVDGRWYLDVANGEYDLESLPVLTDDDILEFEEQPTLMDSAVNSVSVKYFDPAKKEVITTPPVQAPALIADFGTNHLTLDYLEIPTGELAARVAQRELLARITPLRGFPLKTTRKPYAWRPSTYFRLQVPKRGIADMVCIFSEKSSGQLRSGAMSISATQDVYSLPAVSFVQVEPGVDTRPPQTPAPIALQLAFEAPYIEAAAALSRADLAVLPPETGFLVGVAADPANSRDFSLVVDAGAGYVETAYGDWCATALVLEASGYDNTSFTLVDGHRTNEIDVGMPALWGAEIVRVDSFDEVTGTITLGRGCGDTVPSKHGAGERIWFYSSGAAADPTEYTDGETLAVKLLTNTGSQQLDPGLATEMALTFNRRLSRPYPPAKLRINGELDPSNLFGALTVAWVHRDRLLQADQLVDTEMAGIGPESGTTYTMRTYVDDVLDNTQAGISGTSATVTPSGDGAVRIELESLRDGLPSWQAQVREFAYTMTEADVRITDAADTRVTDSGHRRTTE